jgi:protein SCO1/2
MRSCIARVLALGGIFAGIIGIISLLPAEAGNSRYGANYFPNTTLITQDGKQVKFYDDLIRDKIVVIDLIYTQCKDACPLETARLRQVQKLLGERVGKDIFFYSISIDPQHDTPEVLRDYAEMYNAGPGWLFLTGKKDEIDALSKKIGLYTEPNPNDRDGHMPAVLIGNEPAGQWIRNSATDNPHFLATMIGEFIDNWRNHQPERTSTPTTTAKAPQDNTFDQGRYLFSARCAACHGIGSGNKIAPDLSGVTKVRGHAWLVRMISTPDRLLDEKDPIATDLLNRYKVRMPNLRLSNAEVTAIITFLEKRDNPEKHRIADWTSGNATGAETRNHDEKKEER